MGICPFQNLQALAHWAFALGHGQSFSQMPYGMFYIFGIFLGARAKGYLPLL